MKYYQLIIILLLSFSSFSQEPNECVNAIIVCGNSNLDANVNGFGTQEIAGLGCSSQEHNSLWLQLNITSSGTLGFTLAPDNNNIQEDYDFWVFGPDVTCGNLSLPIRCSTTNPQAANQGNNLTGMNEASTDQTEGPGANGDSFVQWLDVIAGESYYIVIDRPVGNSGFSLEWIGTAGLGESPTNQAEPSEINYNVCDSFFPFNDGIESIDLELNTALILGSQTNITVTYHLNESDAILNINPIISPYNNTAPEETIFIRLTDNLTGCFDISSLDVFVGAIPDAFNATLFQCDEDGIPEGFTLFNLTESADGLTGGATNVTTHFYTTLNDAENSENEIDPNSFSNWFNPQIVYVQVIDDATGCFSIAELTLEVSATNANDAILETCDDDGTEDGFYTFNLLDAEPDILNGLPTDLDVTYYEMYNDALLETNAINTTFTNTSAYSQTIYARVENMNACYGINEIQLTVFKLPNIETEHETFYCLNDFPETVTISGGVIDDLPNNYYYLWSNGEDASEIEINEPGTYTVTVTSVEGCSKSRTVTVLPSNIASIENIVVVDATSNNTITVLVSGEGEYAYSLNNELGPYSDSNIFHDVPPGIYTVYVKDIKNDCGIVNETVSVIGFPKFFTPNHDGANDTWQIKGINEQFQPNTLIYIFDRYGKLITQLDPLGNGWDGTFNGLPVPATDYWFAITLQDGREYKNHFALKR